MMSFSSTPRPAGEDHTLIRAVCPSRRAIDPDSAADKGAAIYKPAPLQGVRQNK